MADWPVPLSVVDDARSRGFNLGYAERMAGRVKRADAPIGYPEGWAAADEWLAANPTADHPPPVRPKGPQ